MYKGNGKKLCLTERSLNQSSTHIQDTSFNNSVCSIRIPKANSLNTKSQINFERTTRRQTPLGPKISKSVSPNLNRQQHQVGLNKSKQVTNIKDMSQQQQANEGKQIYLFQGDSINPNNRSYSSIRKIADTNLTKSSEFKQKRDSKKFQEKSYYIPTNRIETNNNMDFDYQNNSFSALIEKASQDYKGKSNSFILSTTTTAIDDNNNYNSKTERQQQYQTDRFLTPNQRQPQELYDEDDEYSFSSSSRNGVKRTLAFKNYLSNTERNQSGHERSMILNDRKDIPENNIQVRKMMYDAQGTEFSIPLSQKRQQTPLTQRTKESIVERKKITEHFKNQGSQKYQNKVIQKEMERQEKILANRIKRLEAEQTNVQKQLLKTEQQAKRTIENKQRHLEELKESQKNKIKKQRELEDKRKKIYNDKQEQITNLRSNLAINKLRKSNLASELRQDIEYSKEQKRQFTEKENKKRNKLIEKTVDMKKRVIDNKEKKTFQAQSLSDSNHKLFINGCAKRTIEIQSKIQIMSKLEENLIEKIKTTQNIKHEMEQKMKKLSKVRVSTSEQQNFEI